MTWSTNWRLQNTNQTNFNYVTLIICISDLAMKQMHQISIDVMLTILEKFSIWLTYYTLVTGDMQVPAMKSVLLI